MFRYGIESRINIEPFLIELPVCVCVYARVRACVFVAQFNYTSPRKPRSEDTTRYPDHLNDFTLVR